MNGFRLKINVEPEDLRSLLQTLLVHTDTQWEVNPDKPSVCITYCHLRLASCLSSLPRCRYLMEENSNQEGTPSAYLRRFSVKIRSYDSFISLQALCPSHQQLDVHHELASEAMRDARTPFAFRSEAVGHCKPV